MAINEWQITDSDLYEIFKIKHGDLSQAGWSPKQRFKYGYYQPNDYYEAMVKKAVNSDTKWLDIGGGRAVFPENPALSATLTKHCKRFVVVDPSDNVLENPYAHLKIKCAFENFETDEKFDLATFRMVAEHISNPEDVLSKLSDLLAKSAIVIIYTINKKSPIPIITRFTPFSYHHKIKRFFWGGEEKDTFPISYK